MAGETRRTRRRRAGAAGPRKLDRRDVLKGLSTVPALGLFGYAWQKQRQYQQAKVGGGLRGARGGGRPAGDQRGPARRGGPGPGADRRDAPHSRPALPRGVRRLDGVQPEARRQPAGEVQARGQRLRGLPRDARQGEGARRGRHRHARFLARAARGRLPRRPASTCTARRRCRTPSRARGAWWRPPARPASSCRSATSAARTRATSTATRSCSARRSCSAGS